MKALRVTRAALRAMEVGEELTFELPTARACANGATCASLLGRVDGLQFSVKTDYDNRRLTVTRRS